MKQGSLISEEIKISNEFGLNALSEYDDPTTIIENINGLVRKALKKITKKHYGLIIDVMSKELEEEIKRQWRIRSEPTEKARRKTAKDILKNTIESKYFG